MDIKDICINENKSIKEAMNIIDHGGLKIAFVTNDDEQLSGVVTAGDLRNAILQGSNLENNIKKIMNSNPVIVNHDWDENEIKTFLRSDSSRKLITENKVMRLPVINEEKKVVDMIIALEDDDHKYLRPTIHLEDTVEIIRPVSKVLVVGGAGYLGSILCRKLLKRGYQVRVLDSLMYGDHGISDLYDNQKFEFIKGDVRNIQTTMLAVRDVDAAIHLAAIVGDPASSLDPLKTIEINYLATKMLAEVCKYSQINRFLFASTCSVYGASTTPDTKIDEESKLNPVSLYAEMKLKSELGILELEDENFSPTILRMATLFGLSPRMRFDLVVNTLTINALINKEFSIFGGQQWRPNLHVEDAADAYIKCLEQPISKIKGQIFNVGSNEQNYKILEIGEIIKNSIPDIKMKVDQKMIDERNFNVSFDKIRKQLNYCTNYDIEYGINEIKEAVKDGDFVDFTDNRYNNYKFLQQSIYSE